MNWLTDLKEKFILNFVEKSRYRYLLDGLGNTLIITLLSVMLGIVIGVIVASVRSTYDKNSEAWKRRGGVFHVFMKAVNRLCHIYITVIRGTPVVVQLMILYCVILASSRNDLLVAVLAFGINSGAYVAEIIRSGLMSIPKGQTEAGRSLGFNFYQTMIYIVIPQAVKNILPALGNEMITLLKDTSLVSVIALRDVTKQAQNVVSVTYNAFVPYITLAIIYLVLVLLLTKLLSIFERRLRKSEH